MSRKWVVFDFCETLVSIQTADAFIDFAVENSPNLWRKLWRGVIGLCIQFRVYSLANRLFPMYNLEKRMRLFLLRGFSREALERLAQRFAVEVLVTYENVELMDRLGGHLRAGDFVQLSSGGLGMYLRYWSQVKGIDLVHATELDFHRGVCTGFIKRGDCMYSEKVVRLKQLESERAELAGLSRVVYTDSITDLPLLQWSDEAWVISYEKGRNWPKKYGFKEIILNRKDGKLAV